MRLRHDEIEYNEKYIELFKKVNKEVEELLDEQGVEKTLGYIHIFDSKKKEILKSKYGIDWKTTSEMNPDILLDQGELHGKYT